MRLPVMLAVAAIVIGFAAPDLVRRLDAVDAAPQANAATETPAATSRSPGTRLGDLVFPADSQGHFRISARASGQKIDMLADTGATLVALRLTDARRIGLRPSPADFDRPLNTANGVVMGAVVTIPELQVGSIRTKKVEAVVLPDAALGVNLLGMSFLKKLTRFEISDDRLVLTP